MLRSISKQSGGIHVVSSEEEKEDGKDLQERKVFTARCYASAVLAMALCLSVRPSVCRCSTKTAKRRITQTTAQDSSFLVPKISAKFDRGHPLRGRRMQVKWVKIGDF